MARAKLLITSAATTMLLSTVAVISGTSAAQAAPECGATKADYQNELTPAVFNTVDRNNDPVKITFQNDKVSTSGGEQITNTTDANYSIGSFANRPELLWTSDSDSDGDSASWVARRPRCDAEGKVVEIDVESQAQGSAELVAATATRED